MEHKLTRQSLRAAELIGKYLRGTITAAEQVELENWASATEGSSQFMREITDKHLLQEGVDAMARTNTEEKWGQLLDKMIAKEKTSSKKLKFGTWLNVAVVAIIAISCWLVIPMFRQQDQAIEAKVTDVPNKYGDEVLPGSYKAELISGNGQVTNLTREKDSSLKESENIFVNANMLDFRPNENTKATTEWKTLKTANGAEYAVTLEDGTKVWLNAASSLHFPVQFSGTERRVELTGEAFFEVAKNKEKPFIVVANRMEVQAIGTAFNVNSYKNADSATVTTLEEGSIRVTTKFNTVMVKPGEQVRTNLRTTAVSNADVGLAMAWKKGLFQFSNVPFKEVVEQLSRWYDVKVVYDHAFQEPKFFTGEIKRNVPLSKLLQMIELTGIATFTIEKNTLTILPYKK